MQWTLTEEQQAYQDALRSWLAKHADAATVRGWLDAGDATTFAARFEADGWLGVGVPEEHGGQGGCLVELAITAEELGRCAAPSASWLAEVLTAPVGGGVLAVPAEAVPHRTTSSGSSVPRVLAADVATSFVVPAADGLRRVPA